MHVKHYAEQILAKDNELMENELIEALMVAVKHLKACDKEAYRILEMNVYKICYGDTLSDDLCTKWVSKMKNEDGSTGGHWTVEETTKVAGQHSIAFKDFTKYEWYACMNMMYSDYYGSIANDTMVYARMAKAFLCDADANKGKLMRYYFSIAS